MRGGRVIAVALSAAALVVAPGAVAATEVGSQCVANSSFVAGFEGTLFPLVTGSAPASAPAAGIATKWIARVGPKADTFGERLKVLRSTPNPKEVQIVAASPLENVSSGHEAFPIRIPVQAGDRFGLGGPTGSLACTPAGPGEVAGSTSANGALNSTEAFFETTTSQAAVSVVIEPDADGDGYGDETQDQCPQSALTQAACPALGLDAFPIVKKNAVVLVLAVSSAAHVLVSAKVARRPPAPPIRAGVSCCPPVYRGIVAVVPGSPARVRLMFYRGLRSILHSLSPKKSKKLAISISGSADNGVGPSVEKTIEVKLHGQADAAAKGSPVGERPDLRTAQRRARPAERSTLVATLPG